MALDADNEVLRYYAGELDYLRRVGGDFAAEHPKIAARLRLNADESTDPHVERLIEAFAFLTGRIQRSLDQQFPDIPAALLEALYPQLIRATPAMAVARFATGPKKYKGPGANLVSRGTLLVAQDGRGEECTFRTCFDVELLPLELVEAAIEPADQHGLPVAATTVARLRCRLMDGVDWATARPERLTVHISGPQHDAHGIAAGLIGDVAGVFFRPDPDRDPDAKAVALGPDAVSPMGFDDDQAVLPYPDSAHQGYRLLHEYFAFPRKFHFFRVDGLGRCAAERCFDILVALSRPLPRGVNADASRFVLGATPIINLFPRTVEPVRLDGTAYEFPLTADVGRASGIDIHSVETVDHMAGQGGHRRRVAPLYSFDHAADPDAGEEALYWLARRAVDEAGGRRRSRTVLSLVDTTGQAALATGLLTVKAWCTDTDLPSEVPAGARLYPQEDLPAENARCIVRPTAPVPARLTAETLWRLVSHLSLNHLSLADGAVGLDAFREILRLYAGEETSNRLQIDAIRGLAATRATKAVGHGPWRGFCRGHAVTLTLDDKAIDAAGGNAMVLASVVERFLGLYAQANTFTQLTYRRWAPDEERKRWPPRTGEIPLI